MRAQNFFRVFLDRKFYLFVLVVVSIAVGLFAIDLGDFDTFYRAGLAFRSGVNPYTVAGFYSPLHVAFAFAPLTLLPLPLAFHLYAGLVYFCFGLAFYFFCDGKIRLTLLLMCSPLPLWSAWYGNLEAWVLLGAVAFNPTVGLWLVLVKPQLGLVMAMVFLAQRWADTYSPYQVARLAIPVGTMLAISFMFGMWQTTPINEPWNLSLWPIGLIAGIPAALIALYDREADLALFAGPFISPYLGGPASFVGLLPLLARRWWLALGGVLASWGLLIVWRMRI